MNFKKDILLIDTEFSGFDLRKHELLQLAAVLLDRKTLKEKKHFNSFIKPTRWKNRLPGAMEVNRITLEQLEDAPSLTEVIKKFDRIFGHDVTQAYYVGYNDKRFLMESYKRVKLPWRFDYHYLELWGLFYPYMALHNKLKNREAFAGFGLEDMLKHFKMETPTTLHDALTDCRVEAEIFRHVIKALK